MLQYALLFISDFLFFIYFFKEATLNLHGTKSIIFSEKHYVERSSYCIDWATCAKTDPTRTSGKSPDESVLATNNSPSTSDWSPHSESKWFFNHTAQISFLAVLWFSFFRVWMGLTVSWYSSCFICFFFGEFKSKLQLLLKRRLTLSLLVCSFAKT